MRRRFAAALALLIAAAAPAAAEPFRLVALGDMPLGEPTETHPRYEALIAEINVAAPDLVVHVGGTKAAAAPCDDAALAAQRLYLDAFDAPVLYTPGDNEWASCGRNKAGAFDPRERLAHLRASYFAGPTLSFGRAPLPVVDQGATGYPENARLSFHGAMLITAHVIGGNNGLDPRDPEAAAEHAARDAAGLVWLEAGFAAARLERAGAVIVALHGDMFAVDYNVDGLEAWRERSGYAKFGAALQREAAAFGRPVLLIFGDARAFRVFRPFPAKAPNLTALSVFGGEDMHAVEVSVDPEARSPFGFRALINPASPR